MTEGTIAVKINSLVSVSKYAAVRVDELSEAKCLRLD